MSIREVLFTTPSNRIVISTFVFLLTFSSTISAEDLIEYQISDSQITWTLESKAELKFHISNYRYSTEYKGYPYGYDYLQEDEIWWDIFEFRKRLIRREARKSYRDAKSELVNVYNLEHPAGKITGNLGVGRLTLRNIEINDFKRETDTFADELYLDEKHFLERIYAEEPITLSFTTQEIKFDPVTYDLYTYTQHEYLLNTKGLNTVVQSAKDKSKKAIENHKIKAKEYINEVKNMALILTILSFIAAILLLFVALLLLKRLVSILKSVVSYLSEVMNGFKQLILTKSETTSKGKSTLNLSNNATEIMDWLELKNKGVITEEEFETKKKELLNER
jgi:hypothetical protein